MTTSDGIVTQMLIDEFASAARSEEKIHELVRYVEQTEPDLYNAMQELCQTMIGDMREWPVEAAYQAASVRMASWCLGFVIGTKASSWEFLTHATAIGSDTEEVSKYIDDLKAIGMSSEQVAEKMQAIKVIKSNRKKIKKLKF